MLYTMVHIEWFNAMTGMDVIKAFMQECMDYDCIIPDGMHIATGDWVLTATGESEGECSLVLTVAVHNENGRGMLWDVVKPNLMSEWGARIKSLATIPAELARASEDALWDHYFSQAS